MNFESVDTETGNSIGIYATEEEALRDVADALRHGGAEAVATLALSSDEPVPDGRLIAEGHALAERALLGSSTSHPSTAS